MCANDVREQVSLLLADQAYGVDPRCGVWHTEGHRMLFYSLNRRNESEGKPVPPWPMLWMSSQHIARMHVTDQMLFNCGLTPYQEPGSTLGESLIGAYVDFPYDHTQGCSCPQCEG